MQAGRVLWLAVIFPSLTAGCLATSAGSKPVQHVVTADQLAKEFQASELLFQEKYDKSRVQLTAKVTSIDKKTRPDDPSQPILNLLTPREYYQVYLMPVDPMSSVASDAVASMPCTLSTEYAGWVRTLRNGYTITVRGELHVTSGVVGYSSELQRCEPVSIDARGDEKDDGVKAAALKHTK
jgi:hypothetical protein